MPDLRPLRSGDLGWVIHRHGALYAQEYGWGLNFEALVAQICADYVRSFQPGRENAWIAEVDGRPAGSVFCVQAAPTVAKLRLLLVEPHARGHGLGGRLVAECIQFARQAGYSHLRLWTMDTLTAARRLYQRAGFRLVESAPNDSLAPGLVSETWELDL